MAIKFEQRVTFAADEEFKSAVRRLEKHYEILGMSATIRRAVILAARAIPKGEASK